MNDGGTEDQSLPPLKIKPGAAGARKLVLPTIPEDALRFLALTDFKEAAGLSQDAGVEAVVKTVREIYQYIEDVKAGKRPNPGLGIEIK